MTGDIKAIGNYINQDRNDLVDEDDIRENQNGSNLYESINEDEIYHYDYATETDIDTIKGKYDHYCNIAKAHSQLLVTFSQQQQTSCNEQRMVQRNVHSKFNKHSTKLYTEQPLSNKLHITVDKEFHSQQDVNTNGNNYDSKQSSYGRDERYHTSLNDQSQRASASKISKKPQFNKQCSTRPDKNLLQTSAYYNYEKTPTDQMYLTVVHELPCIQDNESVESNEFENDVMKITTAEIYINEQW